MNYENNFEKNNYLCIFAKIENISFFMIKILKMKKITFVFLLLLFISCRQKISKDDLKYLNGYWEIEKVVMPDNSQKQYQVNTTYDYIQITGNQGFRKKVYPQLSGKYQTNDEREVFQITYNDGQWHLFYQNRTSQWKETLISISPKSFSAKNQAGIEYFYKRIERN